MATRGRALTTAMRALTQTDLDPGNCLQTCVACILGVPIAAVPTQVEDVGAYLSHLDEYLGGLRLRLEIADPREHLDDYRLAYLEHVMCGAMRATFAGACDEHCIVGRGGRQLWDPYPTRPGLVRVDWFGLLVVR